MASSLSNLVNNLAEGIHKMKCKYKQWSLAESNIKIAFFFEYKNLKCNLTEYKCLCCSKNYKAKFNENLKKRFFDKYKFCNHDINVFILLLQKGVLQYKYMDDWDKFNET